MPRERSAGAIVFRRDGKKIRYLLLRQSLEKDYWNFPKGNIEKNESEEEAALREMKEETGIEDEKIIDGFKEKVSFFYRRDGKNFFKEVVCFLVETKTKDVKLSWENAAYEWVDFQEAVRRVKENTKDVVKKANSFLESSLSKWV
jgi:tRNA nucleotidyltransferase (CCA-adding enzyme)